MEALIVEPKNRQQLAALKAVLKALDINFRKESENAYNPIFTKKILDGREDVKHGKGVKVDVNNLWK